MCGESVGIGVFAASGAENCTRIGSAPLMPFAPAAGVTDSVWSAMAGWSGLAAAAAWAGVTCAAWLPGDAKATIATPATKTIAALVAVRAMPRRPCHRDPLGLAAVVPSPSSTGWRLRNHPDRDTAPSLPQDFTIEQRLERRLS